MTKKGGKYRTRAVTKTDPEGRLRWRLEFWTYGGWIDTLQGWFDSKKEAEEKGKEMNGELTQEKLL